MFGKLPDLFDRNFAVGFYLPAAAFMGAVALVLWAFGTPPAWLALDPQGKFLDAAIIVIVTWLVAVGLVALNRFLVRLMEGYPLRKIWPFPVLTHKFRRRFRTSAARAMRFQKTVDEARAQGLKIPRKKGHGPALLAAAAQYPDRLNLILPTSFGNRYRAIESYPRVVYGLDAIPAWPRMEAVMPSEFQQVISGARAQLDFAVNIFFIGCFSFFLYLALALWHWHAPAIWLPLAAILVAFFGRLSARSSLLQFGAYVKSAFDLYRGDLAKQMGLELPKDPEAERNMWREVNRMTVFRSAAARGRLAKYQIPDEKPPSAPARSAYDKKRHLRSRGD